MTNIATQPHSQRPAIDPTSIDSRQRVMIQAGTHPMIAERLARDAAANQVLRERHLKLSPTEVETPVVTTTTAIVPEIVPMDAAPDLHV